MATINPHINFNGNAEEAFEFYKSVFGGEFVKITRWHVPRQNVLLNKGVVREIGVDVVD